MQQCFLHISHMYCVFLISGRERLQDEGTITVAGSFSPNSLSDLSNLVMQIESGTMWQLSASHWRVHVYQLTDVWQGVVTVCSCRCHYGITLPSEPDLSMVGGKIRRANSVMVVCLCSDTARQADGMGSGRNCTVSTAARPVPKCPFLFMWKFVYCLKLGGESKRNGSKAERFWEIASSGQTRKKVHFPGWLLNRLEWLPVNNTTSSLHPSSPAFVQSVIYRLQFLAFTDLLWIVAAAVCFSPQKKKNLTIFSHKVIVLQRPCRSHNHLLHHSHSRSAPINTQHQ